MAVRRKRVRWAFMFVAIAGGAASAIAACSFPDVSFAPEGDASADSAGDGAIDSTAVEGGRDADGSKPVNPDVDPEGGSKEASTAGDATTPIDAAGCVTCDCDKDGYNRIDVDAGCDGGGNGKPADCDDRIAAIHPNQLVDFLDDPWPAGSTHPIVGDWDCSGTTTKQYPYNGTCAFLSACSDGFVGNPPCGGTADFLACNQPLPVLGATCSEKSREMSGGRKQGCR